MKFSLIFFLVCLVCVPVSSALVFTPKADIDQRWRYGIFNVTRMTVGNITADNIYGNVNGSGGSFNYSDYFDQGLNITDEPIFQALGIEDPRGQMSFNVEGIASTIDQSGEITSWEMGDANFFITRTSDSWSTYDMIKFSPIRLYFENETGIPWFSVTQSAFEYNGDAVCTSGNSACDVYNESAGISTAVADNTTQAGLISNLTQFKAMAGSYNCSDPQDKIIGFTVSNSTVTGYCADDITGGGDAVVRNYTNFCVSQDFFTSNGNNLDPYNPSALASGTASMETIVPDHPGVVQYLSSTTNHSGQSIFTTYAYIILLNGSESYRMIFKTYDQGVDNVSIIKMGLHDSQNQNEPVDGVYLRISNLSSWFFASTNSARVNVTNPVKLQNNTWYNALISLNATADADLKIYANGTKNLVWNATIDKANVPTGLSRQVGMGAVAHINGGTRAKALLSMDFLEYCVDRELNR